MLKQHINLKLEGCNEIIKYHEQIKVSNMKPQLGQQNYMDQTAMIA